MESAFEPPRRPHPVTIAIPASFAADTPHPREKTYRIGLIARAASIFRIDKILIYPDLEWNRQRADIEFLKRILDYLETPTYLRRRVFRLDDTLRFVGIIPPLRTPSHPASGQHVRYREGLVLSTGRSTISIDAGLGRPLEVKAKGHLVGERVTLEFDPDRDVRIVDPSRLKIYWGYRVSDSKYTLGRILKQGVFDLKIATSRLGEDFRLVSQKLQEAWRKSASPFVAFGSSKEGLAEIVGRDKLDVRHGFGFVVNMLPEQGTETVRTEEAIYATLGQINSLD